MCISMPKQLFSSSHLETKNVRLRGRNLNDAQREKQKSEEKQKCRGLPDAC